MSVFLDTGVIVAFDNPSDRNHETAVRILETAAAGRGAMSSPPISSSTRR